MSYYIIRQHVGIRITRRFISPALSEYSVVQYRSHHVILSGINQAYNLIRFGTSCIHIYYAASRATNVPKGEKTLHTDYTVNPSQRVRENMEDLESFKRKKKKKKK